MLRLMTWAYGVTRQPGEVPLSCAMCSGCSRVALLFGRLTSLSSGEDKFWFKRDEIADVASGDSHAAILTVNGQLFMLGSNEWGQLGVGHTRSVMKPVHVKGEWG